MRSQRDSYGDDPILIGNALTPVPHQQSKPALDFVPVLVVAVGVFALALLCLEAPRQYGRVSTVWLANGLAVAVMLRRPSAIWPALVGAAFLGDLAANLTRNDGVTIAGAIAICNAFEILFCAWVVRRICGLGFDFVRWRDLLVFVATATVASAITAASASLILDGLGHGRFLKNFAVWASADAMGYLILTPALFSLSHMKSDLAEQPLTRRAVASLAVFSVIVIAAFAQHRFPLTFVVPAALILMSLQAERVGATIGILMVAIAGALAATFGQGPLNLLPGSALERAAMVQIYLAVCILCSLPVAAHAMGRRRLNQRLLQAREEAEAAALAKSEFLANMSHELRTPLTSILGFTRLTADQPELSSNSRSYVERVRAASEALLATVNDILDFSKLENGDVVLKPQPVAPAALARSVFALFGPQAEEKALKLEFVCACDEDLMVEADPDRLRQVLLNLIGNAVKFTDAGGVTLTVDHLDDRLAMSVIDTGPGIPGERMDELFRRFSQIDGSSTRVHGGTGLGLAICKGIVEAMGGGIGVDSEVGRGSRFWFEIAAPALDDLTRAEPAPDAPDEVSGLRVLVVDDNSANRELVDLILTAVGAEVVQASDGPAALEVCARTAFDLILMDLRMPGMGGEEAMRAIRAGGGSNAATPILAFTADVYQGGSADARLQGFDGRLAKPLRPEELLAAVAAATAPERGRADRKVLHGN